MKRYLLHTYFFPKSRKAAKGLREKNARYKASLKLSGVEVDKTKSSFPFAFSLLLCLLLCTLFPAAAQDTIRPAPQPQDDLNTAIEDIISNSEIDDQVDYSFLIDYLEDLEKKPLNLNTATREELLMLPGMNDLLVNQLAEHIRTFGTLTSIYELQAVRGYNRNVIDPILPYVIVREIGAKDISPGTQHPSGPGFQELMAGIKGELTQRFVMQLEEPRGYTPPDTSADGSLSSRYAGSRYRSYTRFRARYGKNFSFALTGEKDPGEAWNWDPQNRFYGYDFLSGHLSISNYGWLKHLVVGDYNLQVGQGLILSRGLGFGKGSEVIQAVKMPNNGIRPFSSVNENQFLRGAAATVAKGNFYLTGFYSNAYFDASIQEVDTLTDEVARVSGLQTSGLHRTPSELKNRRAIGETLYGGRVEYKSPTLTVGATHYFQQFDSRIDRTLNDYNRFDFRGNQNYLSGMDFDWVYRNINLFGEIARSQSGGIGMSAGMMASLSPYVDLALLMRRFDRDFHSNKGYVFAERPVTLQNEQGLYLGLRIRPHRLWTVNAYFDQFYFPWNRFNASFPSAGYETMLQIDYKPKRGTWAYVRFRSDNKEENAEFFPPGQQVEYLVPTQKLQLRLHFQTKIGRDLLLKNRLEFSRFTKSDTERHNGFLLYQDIAWRLGFKLKLTARYAMFDIADSDARIYAYENDILGFFSVPGYFRKGSRYYLMANYKLARNLQFWIRLAQSRFHKEQTVGSGLEQIQGNTRSELKLQVRWTF